MKTKKRKIVKRTPARINYPKVVIPPNTKFKMLFLIRTKRANTLTELSRLLAKSPSTLSQHLQTLMDEKMISCERVGKTKVYVKNATKHRKQHSSDSR